MTKSKSQAAAPVVFQGGQKLGGVYVLQREVVDGGQRRWLAQDEVLGKEVSLYFLPDEVRRDVRAMGELRQEVKRNRQLIHPNILRIYDLIEEKDWSAISMDSFDGRSLATMLQDRPGNFFEPGDVKPWIHQLCQTLGDVHKIQVIHRNVAPENLLVDKNGKLLLANFGIARVIEDAKGRLKKKGETEKNLAFLSPQQLDGEPATPADDIYSAGATIYTLLTGVPPFIGGDLMPKIRKAAPVLMMEQRAQLERRGGTILPSWETAAAQCLAKQPADRPRSMYELASKLGLSGKPATEAPSAAAVGAVPAVSAKEAVKELTPERKPTTALQSRNGLPTKANSTVAKDSAPATSEKAVAKSEVDSRKAENPVVAMPEAAVSAPKASPASKASPKSGAEGGDMPNIYPSLYPRRSGSRLAPLATVIGVAALAAGIYYYMRPDASDSGSFPGQSSEVVELRSATATGSTPVDLAAKVDERTVAPDMLASDAAALTESPSGLRPEPNASGEVTGSLALGSGVPIPVGEGNGLTLAPDASSQRPGTMLSNGGGNAGGNLASGESQVPAELVSGDLEPLPPADNLVPTNPAVAKEPQVAAKLEAVTKARQSAEAADKAAREAREKYQKAQASATEAQRILDEKAKTLAPELQTIEAVATERNKREEEMKAAELAAEQARQVADESRKAFAEFEAQNKEKLAASEKLTSELEALKKSASEKQAEADEVAKAAVAALDVRQQELVTLKRTQEDAAQVLAAAEKAADGEAREMAEQREQQRLQIEKEIEDMRRLFEEKMRTLEALKGASSASTQTVSQPLAGETPAIPANGAVPTGTAVMTLAAATASDKSPTAALLAPKSNMPASDATQATEVNSLGMKFAPVGDLLFSVWLTRVRDFAIFAEETKLKSNGWRTPGFRQGPDHPVVNVTWNDAVSFCKWLTERERRKGALPSGYIYRLPSDLEWSKAVGLSGEDGKTPEARDIGVLDVFPWGTQWPPPVNAGNYTGEETGSDVAIQGYDDGYAWTSPVGSFPANQFGLYDMGGNVWQWCMDAWNSQSKAKVLRGASWYNGAVKLSLLSSCRVPATPDKATDNYGFRIVRAPEDGSAIKR